MPERTKLPPPDVNVSKPPGNDTAIDVVISRSGDISHDGHSKAKTYRGEGYNEEKRTEDAFKKALADPTFIEWLPRR